MAEIESGYDYDLEKRVDALQVILTQWHTDENFLTPDGEPKKLSKFGPGPCLRDLVETYAKDVSTGAVVEELIRTDAVTEEGGFYLPKRQGFFPARASPEVYELFGIASADLLETLNYNLLYRRNRIDARYQSHCHVQIPESQLSECREFITERLNQCLREIDRHLTITRSSLAEDESTIRFGVGCYEIQGERGIHDH